MFSLLMCFSGVPALSYSSVAQAEVLDPEVVKVSLNWQFCHGKASLHSLVVASESVSANCSICRFVCLVKKEARMQPVCMSMAMMSSSRRSSLICSHRQASALEGLNHALKMCLPWLQ